MRHEHIARMKVDIIAQCEDHLKQLRRMEERLRGPISSINIEYQLEVLAEKAGAKNARGIMHGAAICFDGFTVEQRAILFYWLYSIEENILRQHRIDWSRGMFN